VDLIDTEKISSSTTWDRSILICILALKSLSQRRNMKDISVLEDNTITITVRKLVAMRTMKVLSSTTTAKKFLIRIIVKYAV